MPESGPTGTIAYEMDPASHWVGTLHCSVPYDLHSPMAAGDTMKPRENDTIIILNEDGTEEQAVVHTVLSVQFMVCRANGRDLFLLNKYEGIDWKHKT